ncbi:glycosyltransferase family 2 protein [Aetokthonos hydrillicola Thurmond2011]|uniref:Glycosyltransferase family 2 protein n=1 Tax=Aetokthonos hydrillicola Thurmond2011 TaxID=2712845 RepID=A0AAP5I6X9_9CYAN|nr:glycosyltransferase family 2 protein [Aetokthonos hydrillicola]MBO3463327.1 glycosyltransferase family 2 protein [Aetokthonos hydrillicola CCALA 1050]MBW4586796.1 glycosyltransferase family 2 protein [Aetokthonos hydrillicola CCALA 1050]MDR9895844.1 glycosyltransferase family 2 protein [Aetokthonos hydrillicola Thurmond2011]
MSNKTVAAYITGYKDYAAINQCIKAISQQSYKVSAIFVLDNSPVSLIEGVNDKIFVNHQPSNIGIGEGLRIGLEWALSKGYDFLWTFDQDSIPTADCLETLLKAYDKFFNENYKISIIAPSSIDQRTNEVIKGVMFKCDRFVARDHIPTVDFYECDATITSGSLICLRVATSILPPRGDLFIDGIDLDYGLRLTQQGFKNLIVPSAIMYHSFGQPIKVRFFNREIFVQEYSALRHYYICRNHTYLSMHYAKGCYKLTSFLRRVKFLIRALAFIMLYDSQEKRIKIWACLLGTFHGLKGKLGKTWY